MEPQKRAKLSKSLDPDEIEEVLMDEELEDEVMEPRVQSSSSSEDEDDAEETEVAFRAARAGDSSNFLNFTGPPNGVNPSAASDINAESSPFSIFILFFRQVFQIILTETWAPPSCNGCPSLQSCAYRSLHVTIKLDSAAI